MHILKHQYSRSQDVHRRRDRPKHSVALGPRIVQGFGRRGKQIGGFGKQWSQRAEQWVCELFRGESGNRFLKGFDNGAQREGLGKGVAMTDEHSGRATEVVECFPNQTRLTDSGLALYQHNRWRPAQSIEQLLKIFRSPDKARRACRARQPTRGLHGHVMQSTAPIPF